MVNEMVSAVLTWTTYCRHQRMRSENRSFVSFGQREEELENVNDNVFSSFCSAVVIKF